MKLFRKSISLAVFLTAGVVGIAQAGVKVDIIFKNPGCVYSGSTTTDCSSPDAVSLSDVKIYEVATGRSCWMTNGNRSCRFDDVQSGGPKLYRFEWKSGLRAAQVVDSWIDVHNTTAYGVGGQPQIWIYDVPAHNVVFQSQVGNQDIGMLSQSFIADRRVNSLVNPVYDPVLLLKGNLSGGLTPKKVPMLDGCYSVFYYADNACPGSSCAASRNFLDYPLCVGGPQGDGNEQVVDLSQDDMPQVYP